MYGLYFNRGWNPHQDWRSPIQRVESYLKKIEEQKDRVGGLKSEDNWNLLDVVVERDRINEGKRGVG